MAGTDTKVTWSPTRASSNVPTGEGPSLEVPAVTDVPPERPADAYVGNIIWPRPGRCFRMVADRRRGGSPIACPEPVVWRGVVARPDGVRVEVEACEEHAAR